MKKIMIISIFSLIVISASSSLAFATQQNTTTTTYSEQIISEVKTLNYLNETSENVWKIIKDLRDEGDISEANNLINLWKMNKKNIYDLLSHTEGFIDQRENNDSESQNATLEDSFQSQQNLIKIVEILDSFNSNLKSDSIPLYEGALLTIEETGVTLDQATMTLNAGGSTGVIKATVEPSNATNQDLTWTSSDNNISTVANGVITPLESGEVVITVTTKNGKTATCKVTVKPVPSNEGAPSSIEETGVTLDQAIMTLNAGGSTGVIKATVEPSNATNQDLIWTSSDNNIATVDNGVITPIESGEVVITVTTKNSKSATCEVTVKPVPSNEETPSSIEETGVTLDQTTMTLNAGGSAGTLKATVEPSDATNQDLIWTSSDNNIATVDNNGVINPISSGQVVITVETKNGKKATCEVTVKEPAPLNEVGPATTEETEVTID